MFYNIVGWIYETLVCSIQEKRLVFNRGFLAGPYCPIYGSGALLEMCIRDSGFKATTKRKRFPSRFQPPFPLFLSALWASSRQPSELGFIPTSTWSAPCATWWLGVRSSVCCRLCLFYQQCFCCLTLSSVKPPWASGLKNRRFLSNNL